MAGRPRIFWLWVGYWMALFVVMHVPVGGPAPVPINHFDKLVHCGLYFLLVWLGGWSLRSRGHYRSLRSLMMWAVVYVAYAALDEWLQSFVGRTMSLWDFLADMVGIVGATILLERTRRSRTLSEP